MPGIYGAIDASGRRDAAALAAGMEGLLRHQAWYGAARCEAPGASLGVLSTSPHFDASGWAAATDQVVAVLDAQGLTLDGRPILHEPAPAARLAELFLREGAALAPRLGGEFNLAFFDRRRARLDLWGDRFGYAHHYYYQDGDLLLFAPEVKAFLAWPGLDLELDEQAVGLLLSVDALGGGRTLLRRARQLPGGSRLEFEGGRTRLVRYWRPEFAPDDQRSRQSWLDEGLELYRASLRKRMPADGYPRVVVPLSGGLDSRLLLRLALDQQGNLEPVTHGNGYCLDYRVAKGVTAALGLGSRHRLVRIVPEWLADFGALASWLNDGQLSPRNAWLIGIGLEIGPGAVPFLNGILGPYLSMGSGHFFAADDIRPERDEQRLRARLERGLDFLGLGDAQREFARFLRPEAARRFLEGARAIAWEAFQPYRHLELICDQLSCCIHLDFGGRVQRTVSANKFFFNDLLPFVDDGLFDLYGRLPPRLKMEHVLYRDMFRERLPELARIAYNRTGADLYAPPAVLAAIARRRQRAARVRHLAVRLTRGWVNLPNPQVYSSPAAWLRRSRRIREAVLPAVRTAAATRPDWFAGDRIARVLAEFDRGHYYHFGTIIKIYGLMTWHRLFIEGGYRGLDLAAGAAGALGGRR